MTIGTFILSVSLTSLICASCCHVISRLYLFYLAYLLVIERKSHRIFNAVTSFASTERWKEVGALPPSAAELGMKCVQTLLQLFMTRYVKHRRQRQDWICWFCGRTRGTVFIVAWRHETLDVGRDGSTATGADHIFLGYGWNRHVRRLLGDKSLLLGVRS